MLQFNFSFRPVRLLLIVSFLFVFSHLGISQEFNMSVQISAPQIQQTNREKFQELRKGLYEFVNEKSWTSYGYTIDERIEGTIAITITDELSSDEFKGKINLVIRRPVYGTSYNTILLNYIDDNFQFQWQEGQPLEFQDGTYSSSLTATIAYWVYIYLGLDFDSFAPMGGTPYFEKAQAIVNSAQGARETGWKAFESMKNRYWLSENLMNSAYSNIRKASYQYHRKGLDEMQGNLDKGTQGCLSALEMLQRAHREKPRLFLMQLVIDAKRDEFINVFSGASPMDKTKAVNILKEIDPSNANDYQKILTEGK
jgi:hypothetical protein